MFQSDPTKPVRITVTMEFPVRPKEEAPVQPKENWDWPVQPAKSPRAQLHADIVEWIRSQPRCFTAPYGVLTGLYQNPRGYGKYRTITFGIARTLDAVLTIWSPKKLILVSSRDGGTPTEFNDVEEFKRYCVQWFGAQY